MRKNLHKGAVYLPVEGVGEVELRFTWEAIAALHGLYGKSWEEELQRICAELDPQGLATIMSIGSAYEVEWWMEKSPPFVPAVQAVRTAIHVAFFGAGGAELKRPPMARQLRTLFGKAFRHGSEPAGERISSGA